MSDDLSPFGDSENPVEIPAEAAIEVEEPVAGVAANLPKGPNAGVLVDAGKKSRLAGLEALRDLVATQLENTSSGRDVAALSRQYQLVLADIETLRDEVVTGEGTGPGGTITTVDEFTARRRKRASA